MTGEPPPDAQPAPRGTQALPPRTPLSWKLRLAYGAGGVADRLGNQGLKDLANPIYNLILGMNPAVIGLVFVLTRFFDGFIDPFIGHWSDNTRGPWGRRKPFMLVGAFVASVALVPVLWVPATLATTAQVAWLGAAATLFFAAYSLFNVPYRALAYEIVNDSHEKTQLIGTRTVFTTLAAVATAWVFPVLQSGWFGSPRESLGWVAGALALMLLASALTPTLWVKEPAQPVADAHERLALWTSLGRTLRCAPFAILAGACVLTIAGVNIGFGFGTYIAIYHVFQGDQAAAGPLLGWAGTAWVVASLSAVALTSALSRRFGKHPTLIGALACGTLGSAASWFLYTPQLPFLQLLLPFLLAPATVGLWLLGESMVADVCAAENARTGERREAMFSAAFGWLLRTAAALAVFGSNLALNATGFEVNAGADQGESVVTRMRLLYAALPASGFIAGAVLLLFLRMPQTEIQIHERR